MALWTYRFSFDLAGHTHRVEIAAGLRSLDSRVLRGSTELARDHTDVLQPGGQRNHLLGFALPDGREVTVEAGYIDWLRTAIMVRVAGQVAYQSHPGKVIRFPAAASAPGPDSDAQAAAWQRNKPSLYADLGTGLLFFVLAKLTDDLTLSALVTAGVGLGLVVVQQFVKVDLLGGLALFGVAMLLVSAGFSWLFDDDWAVMMKGTLLGLPVAALMLGDALFNKGRYFGGRLMRYLPMPLDARRLAMALGLLGLVMALVNAGFALYAPRDVWLYYSSFGDFALSMLLMVAVLRYAAVRPVADARRL